MRESGDLKVRVESIADGLVLHPDGDIDLSRSPSLRTEIASAQRKNPQRLVIDLSAVPYMDSSGVATLVEAMQNARKRKSRLILCGMQEKVQGIFEIARLDSVFTIVATLDAARSA